MSYSQVRLRFLCSIFLSIILFFNVCAVSHKPLKILVVENHFPPVTSTAALNQIIQLVRDGHRVHIYPFREAPDALIHPDIQKYDLMSLVVGKPSAQQLAYYDVVYCMFGNRGKEIMDIMGNQKLPNTKIVTCIRGADITKHRRQDGYYKDLFLRGDLFLPVCHYFEDLLEKIGCAPEKIVVFPSTIDCSFFTYRELLPSPGRAIKIASVCRLSSKKGLQYAIRAVAALVKKFPYIEYKIAGAGDLEAELKQLIISLRMQNNIQLIGRLSQEDVLKLLQESHIFVLPSMISSDGNAEGIPNALKEAMAVGLPVVSTYHAGIPELVVNGVSGFLVPEKNAEALAERIEYLILNPSIWRPMCQAARKTIEKHYERNSMNKRLTPLLYALQKGYLRKEPYTRQIENMIPVDVAPEPLFVEEHSPLV